MVLQQATKREKDQSSNGSDGKSYDGVTRAIRFRLFGKFDVRKSFGFDDAFLGNEPFPFASYVTRITPTFGTGGISRWKLPSTERQISRVTPTDPPSRGWSLSSSRSTAKAAPTASTTPVQFIRFLPLIDEKHENVIVVYN